MSRADILYAQPQGIKLLERIGQEVGPIFTVEQALPLAKEQGISSSYLYWLLTMLAKSGWVESIKRGTYAVRRPIFAETLSPFAIAAALVQPMAISHWSALAQHGFTTQIPVMIQASTSRKVVTPEMRSGKAHRPRNRAVWRTAGLEVEFIYVQPKHFFGHQKIWVNRWHQVNITDPERTALDLMVRCDIFGGMRAAIEILENTLPQISTEKLVDYALQYKVGASIKRLGWLLEQMGESSHVIEPLRDYPVTSYYRLDPRGAPGGESYPRWRIVENIKVKRNA